MSEELAEGQEFSKDELKRALKAFKKRLKLYRRDDESKLGGGAFSSGKASSLVGIRPPDGFPPAIWKALEAKGRIRRVPGSRDTYELCPPPGS
ncbi:MAG: hypothetical protein D6731_14225 [Planctomycetota bacterium]|nr:MAG: hypothetical protein D6731_14225 [Planctomycetota bacterium]